MNLPELLGKIPCLKGHYDETTGEPTRRGIICLTQFLIKCLTESFTRSAGDETQLHVAMNVIATMENILRTQVYNPLHAALESIQVDEELEQAKAALADAKARGTVAWEEIKATLGIGNNPRYVVDGYDTRAKVLHEGDLYYLTPNQIKYSTSIARLLGDGTLLCHSCAIHRDLVAEHATAVYPVNIIPYSQECHECGKDLVKGWDCQLFNKPKDQWAVIRLNVHGLPEVDFYTCRATADEAEEVPRSTLNVIGVVAVEAE